MCSKHLERVSASFDKSRQEKLPAEASKLKKAIDVPNLGRDAARGKGLFVMHWLFDPKCFANNRVPSGFWATNGYSVNIGLHNINTITTSLQ
jgi:hypothetical protein